VRADSIWLDLDRRFLETAKKHFAKYIITEDVAVADRSDEFVRFGLVGSGAVWLLSEFGAAHAAAMSQLSVGRVIDPTSALALAIMRHDFCGPFAVELFVPAEKAVDFWRAHVESGKAVPVGDEAVQVRRIEAGIPWPGHEITEEYLPAETRQLDRAVNFQKGCYLGQEVVERMRSRHVVARQLVGLRIEAPAVPPLKSQIFNSSPCEGEGRGEGQGVPLAACPPVPTGPSSALSTATAPPLRSGFGHTVLDPDGKPTGQVTSACHSPTLGCPIALAYVRTAHGTPGTQLTLAGDGPNRIPAVVMDLPFTPVL